MSSGDSSSGAAVAHASSAPFSSGPTDGGAAHSASAAVQAVTSVLREQHAGKDLVEYLAHVAAVVRLYDRIEDVPIEALSFEGAADAASAAGVSTSVGVPPPASPGARARLSGHQRAASSGAVPSALASALRTTPPPGGASISSSSSGGGGASKPGTATATSGARPAAQVTAAAALGSRARAHVMPSAAAAAGGARGAAARPATTRSGGGTSAPTPPPRPPSASAATRATAPSPVAGTGASAAAAARPSTATSATPRSSTRPAVVPGASAPAATPRTAATAAGARAAGAAPAVPVRTGAVAAPGARPAAAGAPSSRPAAGPTGRAPAARPPGAHAAARPPAAATAAHEPAHATHGAPLGAEGAATTSSATPAHAHAEPAPPKATTSDAQMQTDAPDPAPPAAAAASSAAAPAAPADASALTRATSRDLVDISLSLQPSAVGTMAANTGALGATGLQWDVDFAGAVDANGLPNEDAFFGVRLFGMPFVLCVGVCDGHSSDKRAGKAASHLSCNNMFPLVMQYYDAKKRSREVNVDMESVFASTFKKIEQIMRGVEGPKKIFDYAGTTATCVVVMKSEKPDARYDVHCANVGDSEVLLCGVDGFEVLTTKHNASDAAEVARAQAEGAFVTDNNYGKRVNGLLVTRSLGDLGCEGTISTPSYRMASVDRRPCVIVMGSDGFWDVMPYAFVHEMALSMREQALTSDAMCARFLETVKARYEEHNHRDNITVCVALL